MEATQTNVNIVWTCVAAFLVFFMRAGFAMVETGFTRAKNAVNIIMNGGPRPAWAGARPKCGRRGT